jgi:hypothetical protein
VHADDVNTAFLELQAAIHRQLELGKKYWEIIADNLSKAGWSLGWVSAVDWQICLTRTATLVSQRWDADYGISFPIDALVAHHTSRGMV